MYRAARLVVVLFVACLVVACTNPGDTVATSTSVETTSSSSMETGQTTDLADLVDVDAWIAYQGPASDGSDGVTLIHPDGTEAIGIGEDVGGYGLPDWSPDGTKVVFTTRGGDTEPLYEYDLDSETSTRLFACDEPCLGDDEPSYSLDGETIIFIRAFLPFVNDAPSDCGLWSGNLTTAEVTQITSNAGCDREYAPRLSPDGTTIAYYREGTNDTGLSTAVFILDLASGEETQLTEWDTPAGYPVWSPDGQWIVYATYPLNQFNSNQTESSLYRIRPDGSGAELLLAPADDLRPNQPRYTPDGAWVIFTGLTPSTRELWMIPADGGEPVAVLTGGIVTHAAWQPLP